MIGYFLTFGAMSALAGACWFLGSIAHNAKHLSDRGEPLWPEEDRSWR